jgi:hypothetical protein
MTTSLTLGLLLAALVGVLALVLGRLRALRRASRAFAARFRGVIDADSERRRVLEELARERSDALREFDQLRTQRDTVATAVQQLESQVTTLRTEFASLDEESNLRAFGFYKPHYTFAESERYQVELERIRDQQKQMLKNKTAATCDTEWTVNGSRTEGRKQINQTLKLMLRAFNGESDAAIARVKYNNIQVMETRVEKAREAIDALANVQQCTIAKAYVDLRIAELRLVHEYEEKLQREREEQRRIRDQMRDEEIAQRQLEKAKQEAERDETRYEAALQKAREEAERSVGAKQEALLGEIDELQRRLAEAQANKERAISRAQMTRSGHVYVISNIGSFGENIYKVGLTRRLDPLERIRELGDASVPFPFDIHAIIFSNDAPGLEGLLHDAFANRRVNRVNERKEFFNLSLAEIAKLVREHHAEIEFTLVAEATEFRKTAALIAAEVGSQSTEGSSLSSHQVEEARVPTQP